MNYRQRIADYVLNKKLRGVGAVLIEGATNLLKLNKKIDSTKMKSPSFMMILTAVGQYAYRRDDGVYVVPIGCLRP